MKLTGKQEKFAFNLFNGMPQRESYLQAGYSGNRSIASIDVDASRLAKNPKIVLRFKELKEKSDSDKIMKPQERRERLSEIGRGRIVDYQEAGADGSGYISIGKDSPNTAAIAGIESATKFDENGNTGTLFTKIRLHNPTQAIDLLNKMDKIYSDGATVNIDNRKVMVIVADEESKQLAERLLNGELPTAENNKSI